jgi:predicted nucleic acid-binding protein
VTLVIDASVAFKWFANEPDSNVALKLRSSDPNLIAPELVVSEACNSAWKSFQRGELTGMQCEIVAANIARAFARLVGHAPLATRAMAIAVELRHPAYDCFYLALAQREAAVLVTADGRLIGKIKNTSYAALARHLSTYPAS